MVALLNGSPLAQPIDFLTDPDQEIDHEFNKNDSRCYRLRIDFRADRFLCWNKRERPRANFLELTAGRRRGAVRIAPLSWPEVGTGYQRTTIEDDELAGQLAFLRILRCRCIRAFCDMAPATGSSRIPLDREPLSRGN